MGIPIFINIRPCVGFDCVFVCVNIIFSTEFAVCLFKLQKKYKHYMCEIELIKSAFCGSLIKKTGPITANINYHRNKAPTITTAIKNTYKSRIAFSLRENEL